MRSLLVVVDMVNGFVNFGNLADSKINKITPKIESLIKESILEKNKIVAFCDCHEKNDIEFETYPEHCLKGTKECELIPELKVFKNDMQIINKPTTNGFVTTAFQEIIKNEQFEKVVVCGRCTDICVQNFCASLKEYFDNKNIDTKIMVVKDGVYTFDSPNHNAEECNSRALTEMENLGIEVI